MKTQTKYFGTVEYGEEDVLQFKEGLFGFEDEKQFLLIPFEGGNSPLLCLQSLQTAGLAFTALNPFFLKPDYQPVLQARELKSLGVVRSEELCFYVLCVVRDPISESTVNLKCPVAINDATRAAMQTILESGAYEMRHRLAEFGGEGAKAPC